MNWTTVGYNGQSTSGFYRFTVTAPATAAIDSGYQVCASGFQGPAGLTSALFNVVAANTPPQPPAAPTGFTATAGNAQVALSWTGSAGATSYKLFRSTTSNTYGTTPIATINSGTSYTDTGLTNGTTYFYVVEASSANGDGANSTQVSATPQVPAPIVNPQVAQGGSNTFDAVATNTPSQGGIWEILSPAGVVLASGTVGQNGPTYTVNGWTVNWTTVGYNGQSASGFYRFTVTAPATAAIATGYQVRASAFQGPAGLTSALFDVVAGNAPPQPPAAPTGLTATAGNAQVALSWTASTGATSYKLFRSTTSNTYGTTPTATISSGTAYTDTGLTNGTTYYYVLKASNAGGDSASSTQASATPQAPAQPPAAPTGLSATAGNAQVALSWNASTGATSYKLFRSTTSGSYSATATATISSGTSYTNTGLTNGTKYYFVVKASNTSGTSASSTQVSATPQAPAQPPAAPTGLTATAGNAQVVLAWSASAGATSYTVRRSTTTGSGYVNLSPSPTGTTYTDTGLTNGTTYYYVVKANNAAGSSNDSTQVSATPVAPPSPPTGLSATAGNAQVVLSWTASTGATSYKLFRSTTSNTYSATPTATIPTGTSYTDTGLANGTTYYYVVKASSANGDSAVSNQASATPVAPPQPPAAPTGLSATPGNAQVVLSWTASVGATSYTVSRSNSDGGPYTALAPDTTGTTFTDTGLTNGTVYFYVVSASNAVGSSGNSKQAGAIPQAPALPMAPSNLVATPGDTQVLLQWTAGARATSYEVWRQEGTSPWVKATTTALPASTQSYLQTGLINGTNYSFFVRGVDESGQSGDSNTVVATPGTTYVPLAPDAPTFGATTTSSIDVIPPPLPFGATSLSLFMAPGGGNPGPPGQPSPDDLNTLTPVATGVTTRTPITVSGLASGARYRFRAVAVNGAGQTGGPSASQVTQAVTPPTGAPAAPEAPRFGRIFASYFYQTNTYSHTITVLGTLPPGASDLSVQWKQSGDPDSVFTASGHEQSIAQNGDTSSSSTEVSGLAAATTYVFRLKASNASGLTYGPSASATTGDDPPPAVGAPTVLSVTDHSITVSVPALPAGVNSLNLLCAPGLFYINPPAKFYIGGQGGLLTIRNVSGSTYTISGIESGLNYGLAWQTLGNCVDMNGKPITGDGPISTATTTTTETGSANVMGTPGAPRFLGIGEDYVGVVSPTNLIDFSTGGTHGLLKLQVKLTGEADSSYSTHADGLPIYDPRQPTSDEARRTWVTGLTPGGSYTFRYVAYKVNGGGYPSTVPESPGPPASITLPSVTAMWSVGTPIACAGIRYPLQGMTLHSGATGRLNVYNASDRDILTRTVNGYPWISDVSDTCSYAWSAVADNAMVGIFPAGSKGPTVMWTAPQVSVPTTVTLSLVVTDQAGYNQGTTEGGARGDLVPGAGDVPLHFSIQVQVLP